MIEELQTDMDLNASTVGDTIDLQQFEHVIFAPKIITGVWGAAVLRPQCSCDGTVWYDVSGDVTSETMSTSYTIIPRYFRVIVQTVSGGAATISIDINAKP